MTEVALPPETVAVPATRRSKILLVLLVAAFMDLLDTTIVNVALPDISRDLGASSATLQWVAAGYQLSFALLLITGGRLGDVYGRNRLFTLGVVLFTVASLACGLAPTPGTLIAGRLVQGATGALMIPQVLSLIQAVFPPAERSKAIGAFGGLSGLAAVSGPVLGGLIVDGDILGTGWRPVFLINVPIGIVLVFFSLRLLPDSRSATAPRLDLSGSAVVTVGLMLLVFPLVQGRELGWPAWCFVSMALSPLVLALFVRQQRAKTAAGGSPLMVTTLFRLRSFRSGLATSLALMGCISAFFFILTLTMQVGIGFSPIRAGVTGVPFSVLAGVGAGAGAAALAPRFGRPVLTIGAVGYLLGVVGVIVTLRSAGPGLTSWDLLPALALCGLGFGLVVAPLFDFTLSEVPVDDAGSASGLAGMSQQLGGAVMIAVLGVLFLNPLPDRARDAGERAAPRIERELVAAGVAGPAATQIARGFPACARAASNPDGVLPASCRNDGDAPPKVRAVLARAGQRAKAEAFIDAAAPALWGCVGLLGLVVVLSLTLPRRAVSHGAHV